MDRPKQLFLNIHFIIVINDFQLFFLQKQLLAFLGIFRKLLEFRITKLFFTAPPLINSLIN